MLKNYVDEDYLKGYAVKLGALLWTDETDWSEQRNRATQFVMNQFLQKRYDIRKLMPELVLRSSGNSISATATSSAVEDTVNRLRLVIDNVSCTVSAKVLTLKGSNDNSTYYTVDTVNITTDNADRTLLFYDTYNYYKLVTTITSGVCDFRASLVETVYDELFACKWLVFIFADLRKQEGDQFDLRLRHFEDMYNTLMNGATFYIDNNQDGIPDSAMQSGTLTMTR